MATKPNAFLNQVIAGYCDSDGIIPLTRGDTYALHIALGCTAKEADCRAFASFIRPIACDPADVWSLDQARASIAADEKLAA